VNRIQIPIRRVHLETVFEGARAEYFALLEPHGRVSPLRVRLRDLREKLIEHFHPALPATDLVERLNGTPDRELTLTLSLDHAEGAHWQAWLRVVHPHEALDARRAPAADLNELRASPRRAPAVNSDVRIECGARTLQGTLYNVSEHGLGIALLTTQLSEAGALEVGQTVELVDETRIAGRIRSQYPAAGGCVLGIELEQKLDTARYLKVEA
jgi:hypothetical protein